MALGTVETLLGVSNEKVRKVYELVEKRLLNRLKSSLTDLEKVPDELEFVVEEVTIIRFNRIGSEGMSSESVEGHSASYIDDDFKAFEGDIQSFIKGNSASSIGVVRFL